MKFAAEVELTRYPLVKHNPSGNKFCFQNGSLFREITVSFSEKHGPGSNYSNEIKFDDNDDFVWSARGIVSYSISGVYKNKTDFHCASNTQNIRLYTILNPRRCCENSNEHIYELLLTPSQTEKLVCLFEKFELVRLDEIKMMDVRCVDSCFHAEGEVCACRCKGTNHGAEERAA